MPRSEALVKADKAREAGSKIGQGTLIFGDLDLFRPTLITIGSGCLIASHAMLLCHGYFDEWSSITVGDNCYIGWDALLLPGAVVGNNCVVGAKTVVTRAHPIEDWSLVVGNPARLIRKLNERPEDIERHRQFVEHMKKFIGL